MSQTIRMYMSTYFQTADWQTRPRLYVDRILMAAAQHRAEDMSEHHYFSHVDLNGMWPNQLVRDGGYDLPAWYPDDSNQIESIATGYTHAAGALDAMEQSPAHHDHITGKGFWEDHTQYGVGYSDRGGCRLYVVITAPKAGFKIPPTDLYLPFISTGLMAPQLTAHGPRPQEKPNERAA